MTQTFLAKKLLAKSLLAIKRETQLDLAHMFSTSETKETDDVKQKKTRTETRGWSTRSRHLCPIQPPLVIYANTVDFLSSVHTPARLPDPYVNGDAPGRTRDQN